MGQIGGRIRDLRHRGTGCSTNQKKIRQFPILLYFPKQALFIIFLPVYFHQRWLCANSQETARTNKQTWHQTRKGRRRRRSFHFSCKQTSSDRLPPEKKDFFFSHFYGKVKCMEGDFHKVCLACKRAPPFPYGKHYNLNIKKPFSSPFSRLFQFGKEEGTPPTCHGGRKRAAWVCIGERKGGKDWCRIRQ